MSAKLPRASLPPLPKSRVSMADGERIRMPLIEKSSSASQSKMKFLTNEVIRVLKEEKFTSCDFWEGYKLYCFASYSDCGRSRQRFLRSKMGRIVGHLQNEKNVTWGSISDRRVREVWAMMEEFANLCCGEDWKNLRGLMEEFDDVKKLSLSEKGCLLLQVIEGDDDGNEEVIRSTRRIQIKATDVFEEMRNRLDVASSDLERIIDYSENRPDDTRNRKRKGNGSWYEQEEKKKSTE